MTSETYTLEQFVADLDRITTRETAPEAITSQIAPLLGRLVKNPDAIPARFRGRAADGGRGPFMGDPAPRFHVPPGVWRPGGPAAGPNPPEWGGLRAAGSQLAGTPCSGTQKTGGARP